MSLPSEHVPMMNGTNDAATNNAAGINNNRARGSAEINLSNMVQCTDIDEDDDDNVRGVSVMPMQGFSLKQLRTVCSHLNIKGVKNVKKDKMIDMIMVTDQNRKAHSNAHNSPAPAASGPPRKVYNI
jgi:hypothetical protein